MNFEFEVEGNILRQKSHKKSKNDLDNLFCSFVFTTPNWKHIEKYAIFWNRKGKSTIRYIDKGMKGICELPEMVSNDLYFYVQVYANDEILTQKLKVFVFDKATKKPKKPCYEEENLNVFFKKMEGQIDYIKYDGGNFLIYSKNKLVKKIDIVDEQLMSRILNGITPEFIIKIATSDESDLPISCKLVYKALREKVNKTDLPLVAITGSYNDLEDIPTEFPPTPHTHISNDVVDFDISVDKDLKDFIVDLIECL